MSGLGRQAGYELQAQKYNILTPYEEAKAAQSALTEGGLQNISGALSGGASAGMAGMFGGGGGAGQQGTPFSSNTGTFGTPQQTPWGTPWDFN